MSYFVHEKAEVEGSKIGDGTKVWRWSHVHKAEIGRDCVIGQGCYIAPGVVLGNGVHVENNVSIFSGVTIEDDVFLGPSCVFTNVINPRAFISRKHEYRKTLVKKGASIGANATIICGVTIGEYAAVGAGSVVTHDVLPHALVYGNPAREQKVIDVEFNR